MTSKRQLTVCQSTQGIVTFQKVWTFSDIDVRKQNFPEKSCIIILLWGWGEEHFKMFGSFKALYCVTRIIFNISWVKCGEV
jgi:hypothetical protein